MEDYIIKNPFVGCTARDMHFDEVGQYWCSPFDLYNLDEGELFSSKTPIVVEGVRGSGKTMILKYLSFSVQKTLIDSDTPNDILAFLEDRCFGTYFRYKADFCNLFGRLHCSQIVIETVFRIYFELYIVREIIDNIRTMYGEIVPDEMLVALNATFNVGFESINHVMLWISEEISRLDSIINSSDYDKEWIDKIREFTKYETIIHKLVHNITSSVNGWTNILFVIMLDEYENLGSLQTSVNTLLKQVDDTSNISYRVGMRPAGLDTSNLTQVGEERLQVDRDYIIRKLIYKDYESYKQFAVQVSQKRLTRIDVYRNHGLTDIRKLLGKTEDIDQEAKDAAKGVRQFSLLVDKIPPQEFDRAVSLLSNDEKLLEMYNILLVSRGQNYNDVSDWCNEFIKLRSQKRLKESTGKVKKYYLGYSDKYRLALLFLLRAKYGEKKWYYSFNTFLYLSSGSINDYISLCRNTFKLVTRDLFEDMLNGKTIPAYIQTYGAIDTAEDQMRKVAQSNKYGDEIYCFINNLGGVFEEYHRDPEVKYPETNQFAFVNENQIRTNNELKPCLTELINSGAIIKRQNRQHKSVGEPRGNIYQLNRMFAPIFQFSYRTRGGYNQLISTDLFREMLYRDVPPSQFMKKQVDKEESDADGDSYAMQIDCFDMIDGEGRRQ